jgi:molybdopterin/thiamine biosynthesis adenylyltransferase
VRARIAFRESTWDSLRASLASNLESAAMIQAGIALSDNEATLLVRHVDWLGDPEHMTRASNALLIGSPSFVPAFGRAATEGTIPIFFHTHPAGDPTPSLRDLGVEPELRRLAHVRTGQPHFGALIMGGEFDHPTFTARLYLDECGPPIVVEAARIIGRNLAMRPSYGTTIDFDPEVFDRHVRAFGAEGQAVLASLHAGVVGAGGTGSPVFEQLVRLGVGRITVIDDDVVTVHNLTRIHEAGSADVGRPKVDTLNSAGDRIDLGTRILPIRGRVTTQEVAKMLRHCDVVFGCTDDEWGRSVLSKLAYWYLIPVFDTGVVIDCDNMSVRGIFGRITTIMPGTACLHCRGHVSSQEIAWEQLSPHERNRLVADGYVPALRSPAPAVVSFTTMTASYAVSELLERLFAWGEAAPSELLLRINDRKISHNVRHPRLDHYCADESQWGSGDRPNFLGLLWTG